MRGNKFNRGGRNVFNRNLRSIKLSKILAAFAMSTILLISFQNCSAGFNAIGASGSTSSASIAFSGNPSAEGLVQASNLQFLGGFRVPQGANGDPNNLGFSYGGTAITYDPVENGIYMVGHPYHQLVGEISIPPLVNSSTLSNLNTANMIQNFADVTNGHLNNIGPGGSVYTGSVEIGGLMVFGDQLIGSDYAYYDGSGNGAVLSHFTNSTTLSQYANFQGMYQVGTLNTGFVAGYMTQIPQEWQSLLGGPVLTGLGGIPIISRSSEGPAASVFDPSQFVSGGVTPATPVVGYPSTHPTLGAWDAKVVNLLFDMATAIRGVVFVQGTRTVLFFGTTGLGVPCYGIGTSDKSLVGTIVPGTPGEPYCYDPAASSKGCHAYPYTEYVWAYDANDFVAVKNGQKNMWDIVPYSTWQLNLPITALSHGVGGAAYDPATQTIYITSTNADPGGGYFAGPIVYAFKVQ